MFDMPPSKKMVVSCVFQAVFGFFPELSDLGLKSTEPAHLSGISKLGEYGPSVVVKPKTSTCIKSRKPDLDFKKVFFSIIEP